MHAVERSSAVRIRALSRAIALGHLDLLLAAWNLVVLVAYCAVGFAVASVTFRRRLIQ